MWSVFHLDAAVCPCSCSASMRSPRALAVSTPKVAILRYSHWHTKPYADTTTVLLAMALHRLPTVHQARPPPLVQSHRHHLLHTPARLLPACRATQDPRLRDKLVSDVEQNRPYNLGAGKAAGTEQPEGQDQQHKHKPSLTQRIKHTIFRNDPEVASSEGEAPHIPAHNVTQDFTMATQHAVVAQTLLELSEPRNIAVISALTSEIFGQIGRQLNSEAGRRRFRVLFHEAVNGGIAAVEHKALVWRKSLVLPPAAALVLGAIGAFLGLLALGLLLALWRFALFGLS